MVANLRNVDEDFARRIADGLGLDDLPPASDAGPPSRSTTYRQSPALSIVRNGPDSFAGRKVGVLVTDGTDAATLDALATGAHCRGRPAWSSSPPRSAGSRPSTARTATADQNVDGGPSVLYDAVALLPSAEGAADARRQRRGEGLRHRRPRPLQVHRPQRGGAEPCSMPPA